MAGIGGEKAEGGQRKGKGVRQNEAKGKKTLMNRSNILNLDYKTNFGSMCHTQPQIAF